MWISVTDNNAKIYSAQIPGRILFSEIFGKGNVHKTRDTVNFNVFPYSFKI